MPDLKFSIERAGCVPFAAQPMIAFRLNVENSVPGEAIHSIALHAQIQIETTRRRYAPAEKERLHDLFGEPERWGQTLRSMLWTHAHATVPGFTGAVSADLHVPCSFDFNLAATKYFHGIGEGEIPLDFLFSGSCFYAGAGGGLEVAPIPWSKETRFRLSSALWKETIDAFYPNSAWLRIRRDVFDRLCTYKTVAGIATWEATLERLLEQATEGAIAR